MNEPENKIQTRAEYIDSVHRMGRIGAVLAIIIMLSMPITAGIYFDSMPGFLQVITASAGLLALFVPSAISEVIAYTPILGSSIYLSLVTGNVTNLKLPVANNAMNLLDVQNGSENADVISGIAISISSFTTVIIIALGVMLMVPLQPILSLPAIKISSNYILPSLFGSMLLGIFSDSIGGGVRAPGRLKGAIVPAVIVIILSILDSYVLKTHMMSSMKGFLIILMLPVAYIGTKILYKRGQIKVILTDKT